ncbi:DUF6114 domain-containing protein [Salininema proteolyticum]|uniref:DUF6114 domain-containing protein n=1 Tax=Salininema proteolyticum TaxID=1607685 RepID=A0ABV8TYU4_9ACTN
MPRHEAPKGLKRGWLAWRRWRRSRPFWGGLLALLGAVELYSLLGFQMISISVVQGVGQVATFGICLGVLAMVGVAWFQVHLRSIAGILIVIAGLLSMPLANLGGFVIGMLLMVIGGGLVFAWNPPGAEAKGKKKDLWDEAAEDGDDDAEDDDSDGSDDGEPSAKEDEPEPPREDKGGRMPKSVSAAVMAVALGLSFVVAAPSEPAYAWCLFFCDDEPGEEEPGETPSESPSESPSEEPDEPGDLLPGDEEDPDEEDEAKKDEEEEEDDEAACEPEKMPEGHIAPGTEEAALAAEVLDECSRDEEYGDRDKEAGAPVVAAAELTTTTADKMIMEGASYEGLVTFESADGPVKAMKFTMDKLVLENADQSARVRGTDERLHVKDASTVTVTGNVELYAVSQEGLAFGLLPLKVTADFPLPWVPPYLMFTQAESVTAYWQGDLVTLPQIDNPVE